MNHYLLSLHSTFNRRILYQELKRRSIIPVHTRGMSFTPAYKYITADVSGCVPVNGFMDGHFTYRDCTEKEDMGVILRSS
jgi:hypothetical protein